MKAVWLGALKNDERDNFRKTILNSKIVLDKLQEIVYNMLSEREQISFRDYDSPSWSHKQAHTNGYGEALRQVLDLLDIEAKPNA